MLFQNRCHAKRCELDFSAFDSHVEKRRRKNREDEMAVVYIEARPKGRAEGSPITDYVVEDHTDHELGKFDTQKEAIDWAKNKGHSPHVARVRHLNDKKKPDHWRAV